MTAATNADQNDNGHGICGINDDDDNDDVGLVMATMVTIVIGYIGVFRLHVFINAQSFKRHTF